MDAQSEAGLNQGYRLQPRDDGGVVPGGFWRRLGANFIDGIISGLLATPFRMALMIGAGSNANAQNSPAVVGASYAVSFVIAFFYFGWFYANKGATPGKLALGLRVVDAETGAFIGYGKAFLRETIGKFVTSFTLVLILGFMIFFRADKRMLHDLIAGTRVIRKF